MKSKTNIKGEEQEMLNDQIRQIFRNKMHVKKIKEV
jgi:hypothetical protein